MVKNNELGALPKKDNVLYVDVDGTLLLWPGDDPGSVPRPGEPGHGQAPTINTAVVMLINARHSAGWQIIVWSNGGARHAELAAKHAGVFNLCHACLAKPRAMVDNAWSWWDRIEKLDP